jgi:3-hydroxybutyrate dehydrogenase
MSAILAESGITFSFQVHSLRAFRPIVHAPRLSNREPKHISAATTPGRRLFGEEGAHTAACCARNLPTAMEPDMQTSPFVKFPELTAKTAIVTGSTSGIGLGIARAFAAAGMQVMLNGLGPRDEIEDTLAGLRREFDAPVGYSSADMAKPADIRAMIEQTSAELGPVDVLVNNAGIQHVEAIESFPPEKWDAILAVNLSSAFHATRAVVSGMKTRGWGRIINVASAHGLVASPFKSAYVAAKHGLVGLTKAVALETAEHGITVNAICPGYVLTPLVEKQIPETARARGITVEQVKRDVLLHAQPTRRFVTTEELGAVAAFLCTGAAASITGTALPVEGGWTAQ